MAESKPYKWKPRKPIRKNQCKARGCWNPVWKEGYCYRHQYYVQAKKPIPKFKKKKPSRTEGFGFKSQMEMFQDIIYRAKRPITCPISGRNIDHLFRQEPAVWICCMMHVLPKGKYPLFKLYPGNMFIADPEVHRLYDSGTEAQRIASGWDFNMLYELRDKLKLQYEHYSKTGQTEISTDDAQLATEDPGGETSGQKGDL